MSTEPHQNQLEKWRRQERHNQILVRLVLGFLICLALATLTLVVINLLRGTPTLTPATLLDEWKSREGQTVRVRGEVSWTNGPQVRIQEGTKSVLCNFLQTPQALDVGRIVTVQGTVSSANGLTNCQLIGN